MAKRGLNQVDGRSVIERMRCVSVAQPVRAYRTRDPGSLGRRSYNRADPPSIKVCRGLELPEVDI